jgi:hypothetical protein
MRRLVAKARGVVGFLVAISLALAFAVACSNNGAAVGIEPQGDAIHAPDWSVVVQGPTTVKLALGDGCLPPEIAAGKFVIVPVRVTNEGGQPSTFPMELLNLVDDQDRSYGVAGSAVLMMAYSDMLLQPIGAGDSHDTVVVFDVPRGVKAIRLKLDGVLLSKDAAIVLSALE